MKRIAPLMLLALLLPAPAFADITAFLGVNPTPLTRPVKGFAVGMGLLIVGFEFEYADTSDKLADSAAEGDAPRLRTYMGNGLVQTPVPIAGMQFYATAGGGMYREAFEASGWKIRDEPAAFAFNPTGSNGSVGEPANASREPRTTDYGPRTAGTLDP